MGIVQRHPRGELSYLIVFDLAHVSLEVGFQAVKQFQSGVEGLIGFERRVLFLLVGHCDLLGRIVPQILKSFVQVVLNLVRVLRNVHCGITLWFPLRDLLLLRGLSWLRSLIIEDVLEP